MPSKTCPKTEDSTYLVFEYQIVNILYRYPPVPFLNVYDNNLCTCMNNNGYFGEKFDCRPVACPEEGLGGWGAIISPEMFTIHILFEGGHFFNLANANCPTRNIFRATCIRHRSIFFFWGGGNGVASRPLKNPTHRNGPDNVYNDKYRSWTVGTHLHSV